MALKIGGITIDGPKTALLVLPREGFDIPLKFIAVTSDEDFDKVCPAPVPPRKHLVKEGVTIDNVEDPAYKSKVELRNNYRTDWFFLKSIEPSQIEWNTVDMGNPITYANWRNDLKNAGFSVAEINQIFSMFLETNMVSDAMLNEARKRFLASQEAASSPMQ